MKYRLPVLLFVLSFLLSAASCAPGAEKEAETDNVANTAQTEAVQPSNGSMFRLGSLPETLAVPAAAEGAERLYSGYTQDFISSPSYGRVYIYEGSVSVCSDGAGHTAEVVRYGICTGTGSLVTDAVFSDAYPVLLADGTVYYALERLERVEVNGKKESNITVFFVSPSGAWSSGVFTVVGDSVKVVPLNNGGICMLVEDEGVYGKCYILNKNCDVISFISSSDSVSYSFGSFEEGLCPVMRTENGKTEAYYIDVNGNKLFGGYSYAEEFVASRAVVRDSNGDYLVIDTTGYRVIGPVEYTLTAVGGSYFICHDKSTGGTAVYDSSGVQRRVIETKGEIKVLGKTVPVIFEQSTGTYYSVFTGTALRCHNTGEAAQEYLFADYYVYYGKSDDGLTVAYIFNANGDFVYSVYDYGGLAGIGFAGDTIAVHSGKKDGSIRFVSLASRSLTAEMTATGAVPADENGLFALCTQTDEAGNFVRKIYRLSDMSVFSEDFDSAKVICVGDIMWVNSRKNGRLILSVAGNEILSLPDRVSD